MVSLPGAGLSPGSPAKGLMRTGYWITIRRGEIDMTKLLAAPMVAMLWLVGVAPPVAAQSGNVPPGEECRSWYAGVNPARLDRQIADCTALIHSGTLSPNAMSEILYFRGKHLSDKKDHAGAIADFTAALRLTPRYKQVYVARGRAYAAQGDHVRAIADFSTVIETGSFLYMDQVYLRRALSLGAQGNHARAIADLNEALRLDPEFADAFYVRGAAALRLGRTAEGQADIARARALDPRIAETYRDYGLTP